MIQLQSPKDQTALARRLFDLTAYFSTNEGERKIKKTYDVMVGSANQLVWCPEIWSNVILDASVWKFLDGINI